MSVNMTPAQPPEMGRKMRYEKTCGAIVCSHHIEGVTQKLDKTQAEFYGAHFFLCESATESAGERLAELFGFQWIGQDPLKVAS